MPRPESRSLPLEPPAAAAPGNATVTTYVSLFLLIFVFFIVLFSAAELRHDKEQAVLGSLDQAFGHLPSRLGLLPAVPAAPLPPGDAFARDVGQLLASLGPFQPSSAPLAPDVLLSADVDEGKLFLPDGNGLRPELAPLIDRLAVLLQRHDDGQRYRLIWNILATGDGSPSAATLRAIDRGSAAAAALYARGCPGDAVAVALAPGEKPGLRLDFIRFDPEGAADSAGTSP